ncbi:MAG: Rho termination factor N-terminal domain-containing protein, partial [Bacteroidota bacterium]
MYTIDSLNEKLLPELKDLAKKLKVSGIDGLKKQEIIYKIIDYLAANPDTVLPEEPSKKAAEPAKQEEPATTEENNAPSDDGSRFKRRRIAPPKSDDNTGAVQTQLPLTAPETVEVT